MRLIRHKLCTSILLFAVNVVAVVMVYPVLLVLLPAAVSLAVC
jgi:hypothetical protein